MDAGLLGACWSERQECCDGVAQAEAHASGCATLQGGERPRGMWLHRRMCWARYLSD